MYKIFYPFFCLPFVEVAKKTFSSRLTLGGFILLTSLLFINSNFLINKPKSLVSNTFIAYAYPSKQITVDGNISDWSEKLTRYPIEKSQANKPKDKQDFSAYFQIAYNATEQSFYFAIVVEDDSHFIDTTKNVKWDSQDVCHFYLDAKHSPSGSGVVTYEFNENKKSIFKPADSWDAEIRNANWDNVKVASKRQGSKTIYEGQVKLDKQIYAGRSLGIDFCIVDKDAEDNKDARSVMVWGDNGGKNWSAGNLGEVIFMKENEASSTINGQIKWKDTTTKGFPDKIRCTSINQPMLWTEALVDSLGKYSIHLPAGTYKITPLRSFYYTKNDKNFKIDTRKELPLIKVTDGQNIDNQILNLQILPALNLIPEKGILHSNFDKEKEKQLNEFVKAYRDYYEISGVSLALIKDGKVIYHKTYGVKNTYSQEPVSENTLFEAASITKPVFGFVVCRLAERGIIDLDKPLYQYLPFEEIAHDDRYKLITARHVLSHQTGFPNWRWVNPDGKMNIKFTPGTGYGYSGEGFEYLKRVVVHITGKPMRLILEEEVLKPLDLKNTYFEKGEQLAKVVSHGHYNNLPNRAELPDSPGMAWSMHTEANSFTAFILGLLNRKGLKSETYEEMFKIQSTIPVEKGDERKQGWEEYFGLGIFLEKSPYGWAFGHGGNNGDFKCQFKMYKDLNVGFAIFTNSNTGGELAYDAIDQFLVIGKQKAK